MAAFATLLVCSAPASAQPQDAVQRLVADYQQAEKLRAENRNEEAARLYASVTAAAERLFGPEHPNTCDLLNNHGLVLEALGRYAEARDLYKRCADVAERRFPTDARLPRYLTNLGEAYRLSGSYPRAEAALRQALGQAEKLGPGHEAAVAEALHRLGVVLQEAGDLSGAEPLYRRSLELREAKLGADAPDVADTLNVLGGLYSQLGQDARAVELYGRALKIRERKFGPDGLATAYTVNDLAVHHLHRRDFAAAEPLFRRAFNTFRGAHGPDHPLAALAAHNLAWACLNQGKADEGRRLQDEAVRAWQETLRPDHPNLALGLSNQAVFLFAAGQDAQAETLQRQALAMRERALGRDHPNVAASLARLAAVAAAGQRWYEAGAAYDRALRVLRRHTARTLPALPEHEQLAFLQQHHTPNLHAALALAWHRRDDPKLAELSAGWVLNGKGVTQEVLAAQALLARDSSAKEAGQTLADLRDARARLAALAASPDSPTNRQDKEALAAREGELVRRLARVTGPATEADPWVELARVRGAVPARSVLIEIARFRVWDVTARTPEWSWQGERYAAWVIPPAGRGAVRLVDLGKAEELDEAVRQARGAILDGPKLIRTVGPAEAEQASLKALGLLAGKILRPLEEAAGGATEWILGPDAALWVVPWAALPLEDGSYAVEKYRLSYVVSGRYLAAAGAGRPPAVHPPAILAAPAYNLAPADAAAEMRKMLPGGPEPTRAVSRSAASLADLPAVPDLPFTLAEAKAVAPNLERYAGVKPLVYLHEQAQEGVVKALHRPRALVLSTHGVFLEAPAGEVAANPLLRCGLLLAGCNRRREARPGEDDGILTGLEIVGCELRGCDLVALSACETGLGDVRGGEGVAGLRQAFQLAGAGAVVASLWQVPDRDTARLMAKLFDELAAGRESAEALRQAQLELIRSHRENDAAAPPFLWAAFTVTGQ